MHRRISSLIARHLAALAATATLLALCPACGTLNTAQRAKGTGVRRTYDASIQKVWNAVPIALTELGLTVASANPNDGSFLATAGITAWSWGEKVAIFVEQLSPTTTRVEVISKRALATNITAHDWENPILDRIEDVLRASEPHPIKQ